ncbi:tryptophan-rich sensory protein [Thiotrichales bacterium 19S9-12]|nr:tryptophan-rich sensory protein [Thiotrichales bacterium 19S9-11]MCF6811036.1 tryptophan-rich sensory protein [Thiotrichales bacterium 19S9-12]
MKNSLLLIGFIFVILSLGFMSGYVTSAEINSWYASLNHPVISPPNWVFAPAWTVIYLLIAIAGWLVFRLEKLKGKVLTIFILQMILNYLWTFIFFGLHQVGFALIEMSALWCLILWNIKLFYQQSKLASYLMYPYIVWVSYALVLNFSYWLIN